jgi:hypothetical protein
MSGGNVGEQMSSGITCYRLLDSDAHDLASTLHREIAVVGNVEGVPVRIEGHGRLRWDLCLFLHAFAHLSSGTGDIFFLPSDELCEGVFQQADNICGVGRGM